MLGFLDQKLYGKWGCNKVRAVPTDRAFVLRTTPYGRGATRINPYRKLV